MKKILVPCDFSDASKEAYKLAMDWAANCGGEVYVLYVILITSLSDGGAGAEFYNVEYFSRMEEDARQEFNALHQAAGLSQVSSKLEIMYGDVHYSIKNFVAKESIDLVVMGNSSRSGTTEFFVGSNAEKVVRHSQVPVITVKEALPINSIKNILLPTTLGLNQTEFISKVKELQAFLHATVHILLINTPTRFLLDREANEALTGFVNQYKIQNYELHFRNYYTVEDGILDFAHAEKMDMIAMATHGRKGLSHLLNGSVAEEVVNQITLPIWTYHVKQ